MNIVTNSGRVIRTIKTTVREFDKRGNVVKETVSEERVEEVPLYTTNESNAIIK